MRGVVAPEAGPWLSSSSFLVVIGSLGGEAAHLGARNRILTEVSHFDADFHLQGRVLGVPYVSCFELVSSARSCVRGFTSQLNWC